MKCCRRSIVSALVARAVLVHVLGRGLVPPGPVRSPIGEFLGPLVSDHAHGSVGGVCLVGVPPVGRWRAVQDSLLSPDGKWGELWERFMAFAAIEFDATRTTVVRLCGTPERCAARATQRTLSPLAWKCELLVVMLDQHILLNNLLRELSGLPFWSPTAVHVFLSDAARARERDSVLAAALLTFGVIRPLFVQARAGPASFDVHFPLLFQRRVVRVAPTEASRRWLRDYDQLANLWGYQHRTLYHTLIPHLYRYGGVFGGPDYRFLQTVLERQNATHRWLYHMANDARLNTTDLQHVDRLLLGRGDVSFSLNRLLADPAGALDKLYLNTFDGTCVLVPRRTLRTFILRLWEPFSPGLWYAVLAVALLAAAGHPALPALFAINYLLALLFGLAVLDYRLAALDRTVLAALDVLLFVLREAYTAKIITHMIGLRYEPELRTVADLGRAGPPLLLTRADHAALADALADVVPAPHVALRDDSPSFVTTWREYFRGGFAHPVPCSYGQALVASTELNAPGAPRFYLLRERLALRPEAFAFRRHSPFRAPMRRVAASLREAGIYGAWLRGDWYARDHTVAMDEILHFENLASLFYVLLVGYAASAGVFAAERLVAYAGRKRAQRWADRVRATRRAGALRERWKRVAKNAVRDTREKVMSDAKDTPEDVPSSELANGGPVLHDG